MIGRAAWTFLVGASVAMAGLASFAQSTKPTTQPARQSRDGTLRLLAIDARVVGERARIEKKGNNPHNIGYWTNVKDKAVWQAVIDRPGRYAVEVEYSLDKRAEGARYVIEFGENRAIRVSPEVTGTWLDFRTVRVGEVELEKGALGVTVRGEEKPGQAVLDLRGITLRPAGG